MRLPPIRTSRLPPPQAKIFALFHNLLLLQRGHIVYQVRAGAGTRASAHIHSLVYQASLISR